VHGYRVPVAGTFRDPKLFSGTMYRAAGREHLGRTKGYARSSGRHADPHGRLREIPVRALRRDARRLLAREEDQPPDVAPPADPGTMRSPRTRARSWPT